MFNKNIPNKIILMSLISFILAFNYYIVRSLKDTLIITHAGAGAEVIPFVKLWILVPFTCLLTIGFTSALNRLSLRSTFGLMVGTFITVFALCTYWLFPLGDALEPVRFSLWIKDTLPEGWSALGDVVRYWRFSIFYVFAENWAPMIYSVLFWGFANEIISYKEAKQFYPYLTLAGTTAALIAGPFAIGLSYFWGELLWNQSLNLMVGSVIIGGLTAIYLFSKVCPRETLLGQNKSQKKVGFIRAAQDLVKSKHLLLIALGGILYTIVLNLSEIVWKDALVRTYPSPAKFNQVMNIITVMIGICSSLITVFITRQSLNRFGWRTTALITPVMILITSTLFFSPILKGAMVEQLLPQLMIVILGGIHLSLSCSCKYTLYDTTKELAYIPLSSSEKMHGKAVIDGVGSRVGKAGSSLILHILLMTFSSVTAGAPLIGVLTICGAVGMIYTLAKLGEIIPAETLSPMEKG